MPTLEQAISTYLRIERRPLTQSAYQNVLNRMAQAIGPSNQVERITYEILLDYQVEMRSRLKATTVSSYTMVIMTFFNWCAKRGYCSESPAVDLVRKSGRRDVDKSRAILPEDLRKLIAYARLTSPKNYAILLLLADSGCRVSALCGLSRADLHLDSHSAEVIEKGGFNTRILFGEETAAALNAWIEFSRPALHSSLFGIGRVGVYAMIKRLCKKAGTSRDWFPHSFRHAVGHAYALAGIPVSIAARKLNHRNANTTLQYYYPNSDPYLEMISKRLPLASMKEPDELRGSMAVPASSSDHLEEHHWT